MSKTKGNVIDPLVITEQYGADALRFTLAALTAQGRDIKLAKERIEGYRAFANKLWNATRFALMNLEGFTVGEGAASAAGRTAADRWILARTQRAVNETVAALEAFRFNDAAGTVYQFVWGDLCDWYIELAKEAFNGDDLARKRAAQATLTEALSVALRLLHPFMPFITEELWHVLRAHVGAEAAWPDSVLAAEYPRTGPVDEAAERAFGPIIGIVDAIRNIRGEMNVPYKVVLEDVEIGSLDADAAATVREELGRVHRLGNVRDAAVRPPGTPPSRKPGSTVTVGQGFEVRVGLAGAVDVAAETARITKEIDKVAADLALLEKKLSNPSFVERAPAEVVEKDRARVAELREKRSKLDGHRVMLADTETVTARRHTVENQNEQKPQEQTTSAAMQDAAGQVQTAVAGAVEKVVETAQEIAKAASSAVATQIDRLRKPSARKPAKKAARKPAKPARAAKKAGKKTASKPAAKKTAKKAAKKAAKKTAKSSARKTAARPAKKVAKRGKR
jgi:valyl-tRNA synthetase